MPFIIEGLKRHHRPEDLLLVRAAGRTKPFDDRGRQVPAIGKVTIQLHATFRKKNPLALLPVLELADGRVLRESIAICRYVEEMHPEPNLMGSDAWERAQVE